MMRLGIIALAHLAFRITLSTAARPEGNNGNAACASKLSGQAALQWDMTYPSSEQQLDGVARGGPYVPSCEQLLEAVNHQQDACTIDEFLEASWTATWELDCQFQKAQNALEMLTNRFQQRAIAKHESKPGKKLNVGASYSKLQPCPNSCGSSCLGQMFLDTADKRGLVVLPQPEATGSAYAYSGTKVRQLTDRSEITSVMEDRINRGLWYASLVGHLENFSQTEKYYFSNGVQSRLRYLGNDPAILTELDVFDAEGGKSMCVGAPNKNIIDLGNYNQFFNKSSKCGGNCTLQSDELRPYWMMGTKPETLIASKVALDYENKPMGTVTLDLSIAVLGKRFLDSLHFTPSMHALIVERSGRIMFLCPSAKVLIFGPHMKDETIYNQDGKRRCSKASPHNCTWEPLKTISLREAAVYRGVDFSPILQEMFNASGTNCSTEVHNRKVTYPDTNSTNGSTHLLSFCALSSVPEWGLITGTSYADIAEAASMGVTPKKVMVNYTVHKSTDFKELQHFSKQVTITNTGRIPFPFQVDISHADFVDIQPRQGLLQHNESVVINVMLHSRSAKLFGTYSGVMYVRANLLESRGTCFRTAAHVGLLMNIIRSKTFMELIIYDYGEWILGAFAVMLVVILFKVVSSMIRSYFHNEARQTQIVEQAVQSIRELPHPMVLLTVADFKRHNKLMSHEEMHSSSKWLYTIDEVEEFCLKFHVVFVSHQWTAFSCPDPTNIQYKAMLMSIEAIRVQEGWQENNMFLWVDYSSIPQKHRGTQALAINSLTVYASNVAAFVVVAPEVNHKDLEGEVCNKETYQRRAWCRAEQLAHLLAVGSKNMYLAEEGVLTPLSEIGDWLKQSIEVFSGDLTCCRRKHEGMEKCDKELLVTPMLGLWSQLCQRCEEQKRQQDSRQSTGHLSDKLLKVTHVYKEITGRIGEVFPSEFVFEHHDGILEQRQLFGDLLDRLPSSQAEQGEGGEH